MNFSLRKRKSQRVKGLYSSIVPFTTDGEAQITADACGMMILPSGDTLRNVLRTYTTQSIRQVFPRADSTFVELNSSIETYKWFSKGYRYPIFETIRTFVLDSTETKTVNFETAFFYPPQEHYYLADDEENLAILDS